MNRIVDVITAEETRCYAASDLPLAIGSGRNAQIPLPEGTETAAWVAESRGYLFLQVETGNTVYHNNEHLEGSVWIKSGDITRIGNFLLHWTLAGDRVEVRVDEAVRTDNVLRPPPIVPAESLSIRESLPRVGNSRAEFGRRRYLLPAGIFFFLLLIAAVFLLTANRVELAVQPEPEQLHLSGFPPALKISDTFLVLNGTYTVSAQKTGYQPLAEQIVVAAGKDTFSFTLKKLPGRVTFTSSPVDGAEVVVDGVSLGRTPLQGVELTAGSHQLRAKKERYLPIRQQIIVDGAGREQDVSLQLHPGWAEVRLTSEPEGAMVTLKDRQLGVTPLSAELTAGKKSLRFTKKGYSSKELELQIVPGRSLAPDAVKLDPALARVHFRSIPSGAKVVVGDSLAGATPVTLELPPSTDQKIHLQLTGYKAMTMKRRFFPASDQEISVTLTPLYGTIFLTTDPVDAVLFVDGKKHGPATGRLRLTTREHRLTVQANGFENETRIVVPKKGSSGRLSIRLREKGEPKAQGPSPPTPGNRNMIHLGPAVVRMGAPRREPGRRANEQERTVKLDRPFLLSVRLITNGEFRRFQPEHRSGSIGNLSLDTDKQPVVRVSWQDATRYCNSLSKQEGLPAFYREKGKTMVAVSPANSGYRLPTEAEWSLAARMSGRQRRARYPWAGKFPPRTLVGNFGDESARSLLPVVISGYNDGFVVTSPVGSFPKNSGGFFDMGGNVRQWCHDWYMAYAGFGQQKETVDPMGPDGGTHHVVRGSSWRDATMTSLRLSYRGYSKVAKDDIGFRVARYIR